MAAKDTDSTFHCTRALLDQTITDLIGCLESKREELSAFIDLAESDYGEKQLELASDVEQLDVLKKQTEAIAKNSLSELQQKLIEDINLKMNNLKLEAKRSPQLKLSFDKSSVLAAISGMSVLGYETGGLELGTEEEVSKRRGRRGRRGRGPYPGAPSGRDTGEETAEGKKRGKQPKADRKGREERKESTGEPVPVSPQGKKGKRKGMGGAGNFDAHALLEDSL